MTIAVVQFPGSNCDNDCVHAIRAAGGEAALVWHKDTALPSSTTGVILPGGFSYGDYLRTGAMASLAPMMAAVKSFVDAGGPVLGICNGFQILCEARILPGALLKNTSGNFVCDTVFLDVDGAERGFLSGYKKGARIQLPVAHGDGSYFADDDTLNTLSTTSKIAFSYVEKDRHGHASLNGARRGIAGILGGPNDNVVGLMPHPERRSEERLGGVDGRAMLVGLLNYQRGVA